MNLDFNYDGKTKLKDWWGKVKANFQTVQDGFNEHRENTTLDHPDKSVKQQHIADKAVGTGQIADYAVGQSQLQQYSVSSAKIYPGAVKTTHLADGNVTKAKLSEDVQQQLDKVIEVQEALTQEISDRQHEDDNLQSQIEKINETSGREALFGKHKIQFVTDLGIPVVQFEGEQMYYGEEITVKTGDYNMSFYVDGVLDTSGQQSDISIPANGTSYIIVRYEFETGDISILHSETYVESIVENGYWNFTAYEYSNFNYDFKTDSESPTGDRYELISYDKNYSSKNIGTDTYTIEQKYGTSDRTLEDLKTKNKDSFLDAVNEIAVTLSPINHRNIFRGKNLGSTVTEAQKTAIQSGTFDDLFVGDYWEIDGVNWRIVDMDYWYKSGTSELDKHHLVIMPDSPLYDHSMNDTAENAGGYVGSLMYTEGLNEAKRIINEMFGDSVIEHEESFVNEVTDGKAANTVWTSTAVDLPSELMIFGSNTLSENRLNVLSTNQLALFRMAPEFLNDRHGFWLRDAVSTDNSFAFTDGSGRLIASGGISTDRLGVRPVFAIG